MEEKPKLTQKDKSFLDENFWIARDKDGELNLFHIEPNTHSFYEFWRTKTGRDINDLDPELFEFITWESQKTWSKKELMELEVMD